MPSLSQYLVQQLAAYGVDTVFGIPGVHTVELYRGLADTGLRHVSARHEQSLGFMADGYARVSGKPGVCFVITGPGLTNILTAMGQAYADSIPMLVISGVNPMGRMGSGDGYLHELPNQQALASQVSAFSHTITHVHEVPQVLARAFAVFNGARPRPVHIEIPLNLMNAPIENIARPAPVQLRVGAADSAATLRAAEMLLRAQSPLIVVGGGALNASVEVVALAERLGAPVVMTINARGLLPPSHPLAISASPSFPAVRALAGGSDVILAVGTEMGPTDFNCYDRDPFTVAGQLIRIDIDPQQIVRNNAPNIALLGDAKATLAALLAQCESSDHTESPGTPPNGQARAAQAKAMGLAELDATMQADLAFLHALRDALPHARWVGDSTRLVYAGNMGFEALRPKTWFNASVGFGALGYGLPAAVGASLADPSALVVCFAGDGGLQFTLAELGTTMEVKAKLVVLVLNNHGYGEIKANMVAAQVAPVGVDLHTPDFVTLAQSYGWAAERLQGSLHSSGLVAQVLAAINRATGPLLMELVVPASS